MLARNTWPGRIHAITVRTMARSAGDRPGLARIGRSVDETIGQRVYAKQKENRHCDQLVFHINQPLRQTGKPQFAMR